MSRSIRVIIAANAALGIGCDGAKTVLGLREGATENTTVVSALLSDLVERGLDFSAPRLYILDGGKALHAAVSLADTKAVRGFIDVHVDVPAGLPQIQADHHQLTQLFTNLLINAYEAMERKGHVVITAATMQQDDGGEGREAVRIEVQDNGPGMAPDVAEHVFDPFFTTKAQGSGLGLAIVRKIVDAHDGQIDLRTTPGSGTLVRVTLPVSVRRDAE